MKTMHDVPRRAVAALVTCAAGVVAPSDAAADHRAFTRTFEYATQTAGDTELEPRGRGACHGTIRKLRHAYPGTNHDLLVRWNLPQESHL
jgi:hypothetical protein